VDRHGPSVLAMTCGVKFGEVAEWSKAHAWKVCIRKRIEGSNPSFSAKLSITTGPLGPFLFSTHVSTHVRIAATLISVTFVEGSTYGGDGTEGAGALSQLQLFRVFRWLSNRQIRKV
jgi:hypothetical protein